MKAEVAQVWNIQWAENHGRVREIKIYLTDIDRWKTWIIITKHHIYFLRVLKKWRVDLEYVNIRNYSIPSWSVHFCWLISDKIEIMMKVMSPSYHFKLSLLLFRDYWWILKFSIKFKQLFVIFPVIH